MRPLFATPTHPVLGSRSGPRRNPVDVAFDQLARRATRDSHLHNTHVLLFEGGAPSLAAVRDHVARQAAALPALAHIAHGRRWRQVTAADPCAHVHEIALADRSGGRDLLLQAMLEQDLPPHGPRWGVWLVHGYADDEYALCYRSHHGFQDASAALYSVRALFGTRGLDGIEPPKRDRLSLSAAARVVGDLALAFLPAGRVAGLVPGSPGARAVVQAEVDLRRLHALAGATGRSINDVYLAVTAVAVGAWVSDEGVGQGQLHTCVPLDTRLRGETETGLGNKLGMARVRLSDLKDICTGSQGTTGGVAAHSRTDAASRIRMPEYRAAMRHLLDLVPGPVGRWSVRHLLHPRHTAMVTSRVVYPKRLAFGGAPVIDAFVIPSLLPGHLCFSTLSSLGSSAHVAFVADAALPGVDHLARRWTTALTDLEGQRGLVAQQVPE
ncbi:wax ester/triacylglycerol synthase domain-containing protein [Streptomyces sp. BP-8]|uniref:Wax ester/triacylglycerol synthase domain-containing protein n=1 Tax=Streptomyces sirii TaxID=3127701 RepID=A0ABZ2QKE6_9ACTN